ncbi:hypothetical protein KIF59_16350 [Enterobacter cloacae subsp. cloacae]|nr:hypothetical protein [Enterobacter cloacae subsp. cloacae]
MFLSSLPEGTANPAWASYLFLRRLENLLQSIVANKPRPCRLKSGTRLASGTGIAWTTGPH